jgi:hypothetical protein
MAATATSSTIWWLRSFIVWLTSSCHLHATLLLHCLQPRLGDPATSGGGLILSTILVAWGTAAVLGGKGLLKSNK